MIKPGLFIENAPGMANVVMNTAKSLRKSDHASMVAQVVGSQIPGIGIAPGARVFLGTPQAMLNGEIAYNYLDAMKLAIRAGAKAINLSFMQFRYEGSSEGNIKEDNEKSASNDFTSAIVYAFKQGIPVFTAGGNAAEDLEINKFLKAIRKDSEYCNQELLVIAGGFEYPDEAFGRDDITFADNSARVSSQNFHVKKLMMTGPYRVEVYEHKSIERRKEKLLAFRKRADAEEYWSMWVKDLSKELDDVKEAISYDDLKLIEGNLTKFNQLCNGKDNLAFAFTLDDLNFFFDQADRTSLPDGLRTKLKKFGRNFLSLKGDLLTTDFSKASEIPAEEQRRLQGRHKGYDPANVNDYFENEIMGTQIVEIKDESTESKDENEEKPKKFKQVVPKHAFSLQTVRGTSFASPARMLVYLLLKEYVEREGNLLDAEDILRCMRASAWQKAHAAEGEDLNWYGSGVIDAGKALGYCQLLVKARKLFQDQSYQESLQTWRKFLPVLKDHVRPEYIREFKDIFKLTESYQAIISNEQEKALEAFYREALSYLPEKYEGHNQDRFRATMHMERKEYEEVSSLLDDMEKKIGKPRKGPLFEDILLSLSKDIKHTESSFFLSLEKFNLWLSSLVESETYHIDTLYGPNGKELDFKVNYKKGEKPGLSLDIADGYKHVTDLFNSIENTWRELENIRHSTDTEKKMSRIKKRDFFDDILKLPKKLKLFDLPDDIRGRLDSYIERAQKEKAELLK